MKVRYTGPSGSGVEVIHPDPDAPDANTVTHCPPGETVDLPDDVALDHLVTGTFEPGDDDAQAALDQHAGEPAPATQRPSTGAPKDAWVAYAVEKGWALEAAQAATKAELIADLTNPPDPVGADAEAIAHHRPPRPQTPASGDDMTSEEA